MSEHEAMTRRRLYPLLGLLGLLIGLLLLLAQGAYADFPHTTDVLLSGGSEPCNAVRPRLARNETGQWLAVSWIQENPKAGGDCFANGGRALLRWATESTLRNGWQGPVALSAPVSGGCVNHVDVAVQGTTAHVVLTAQTPCENTTSSAVHYTTCDLLADTCQSLSKIVETTTTGRRYLEAYVAVDDAGGPHIVYSHRDVLSAVDDWERVSEIWYARLDGTTWKQMRLSNPDNSAYQPRIAWAYSPELQHGYVHLVWETHHSPTEGYGRVRYRRCPDDVNSASECASGNPNHTEALAAQTHPRPALGVSGDRINLFWNYCVDLSPKPTCREFALLYQPIDQHWSEQQEHGTWSIGDLKEVRSNRSTNQALLHVYDGTDDDTEEYRYLLRPAVAMNAAGAPVVGWQIQNADYAAGYTISTTWAITLSATTGDYVWEETGWSSGEGYDTRVSPDIALPDPSLESQGLHLVFMRRQGLYDKYQVYYSYFGEDLYEAPTPTPDSGQDQPTVYLPLICRGK